MTPSPAPLILPGMWRMDILSAEQTGIAWSSPELNRGPIFIAQHNQNVRASRRGTREYHA